MEGVGEAAGVGLGVEADTKRGQVLRDMLMNEWNGTDQRNVRARLIARSIAYRYTCVL
jgi:uncharacterized protein with gpF-like domain